MTPLTLARPLEFDCASCGARNAAPASSAGLRRHCVGCRSLLRVPGRRVALEDHAPAACHTRSEAPKRIPDVALRLMWVGAVTSLVGLPLAGLALELPPDMRGLLGGVALGCLGLGVGLFCGGWGLWKQSAWWRPVVVGTYLALALAVFAGALWMHHVELLLAGVGCVLTGWSFLDHRA